MTGSIKCHSGYQGESNRREVSKGFPDRFENTIGTFLKGRGRGVMTYLHLRFTDDNRKQNCLPFSMELTDEGVSINLIGQGIVEKYCLG